MQTLYVIDINLYRNRLRDWFAYCEKHQYTYPNTQYPVKTPSDQHIYQIVYEWIDSLLSSTVSYLAYYDPAMIISAYLLNGIRDTSCYESWMNAETINSIYEDLNLQVADVVKGEVWRKVELIPNRNSVYIVKGEDYRVEQYHLNHDPAWEYAPVAEYDYSMAIGHAVENLFNNRIVYTSYMSTDDLVRLAMSSAYGNIDFPNRERIESILMNTAGIGIYDFYKQYLEKSFSTTFMTTLALDLKRHRHYSVDLDRRGNIYLNEMAPLNDQLSAELDEIENVARNGGWISSEERQMLERSGRNAYHW